MEIPPPATLPDEWPEGSADPYIGTTFDHRYKIEGVIGEGGMGVVYRARHKVIDKRVAVKVLRREMAKEKEVVERFVQEAKAASSIGHPHIVDISDFGELPDGSTYFVMEYLEGKALTALLEAPDRPDLMRVVGIARQIADGLAAAHDRGIIHRDLKPDNILLVKQGPAEEFVKILDFGIAKVTGSDVATKMTKAGAVFGTPHYMSPEQAAGAPVDHRADIYALGVMLYELVSRQLPFNAENFMGILTQHMYKAPVPIRALVSAPDCPPGLEAVILKCLSKKPELRYADMAALNEDLARYEKGEVPLAVAEMMARSAGFNVPQDYFKSSPKAIVPATPKTAPKRWPAIAFGIAALGGGVVAAILIAGNNGAADTNAASPDPPVEEVAASAADASIVAVAAFPESAVAIVDGEQKTLPMSVSVPAGKTIKVEVKAEGHQSQVVELDGVSSSKMIKLEPLADTAVETSTGNGAAANTGPVVPPPPTNVGKPIKPPPPPKGGNIGEVVDPWD